MKFNSFTFLLVLALFTGAVSWAQEETQNDSIITNPIEAEFNDLMESSNNYQSYKVVELRKLTALQQSTLNHIAGLRAEIDELEASLQEREENIDQQNAALAEMQDQLDQVTAERDAINFLGMPIDKATYQGIMWGIVGVLVLVLLVFIYRFTKSNSETKEAKKRQEDVEAEFELFRAKSLEKEQRLGRLLQDERNKHAGA